MRAHDNKPIDLGYRVTLHWFFLPYSASMDGYVLFVAGEKRYIPLDEAQIANLQKDGLLPARLPDASLSVADMIMGHLLWLALAIFGGVQAAKMIVARCRCAGSVGAVELVLPTAVDKTVPEKPNSAKTDPAPAPPESVDPNAPGDRKILFLSEAKPVSVSITAEPNATDHAGIARIRCRVKSLKIAA